ncbi:hypothetical protein CSHISOI_10456 [Colletotrichum shisoi]|uniref:SET domain-containing protein n=1 Tax=Colletotrichum shisoi TaxID=2078593 RepID=A0A5Q4BDK4_9PEZI|nr:hypothetical protein CSHISOI_10456 [Colletotrichum shisoi]
MLKETVLNEQANTFGKSRWPLASPGLPALQIQMLQITGFRYGSHDDLYVDVKGPSSKARIQNPGLDSILDVNPEHVNSILDLAETLEQLKDGLREFGASIKNVLPPIAIRDITWKTIYITHGIFVGCEPDEFEGYEDNDYHDDLRSRRSSFSTSFSDSGNSNGVFFDRNDRNTVEAPIVLALADLPSLTTFTDQNGTKERSVIFANEFFEIRRSFSTGWGAFAVKELHEGDQILVEKALYYSIHEDVEKSVRGLSEKERAIANDMYAYYSRDGETLEEAIWSTNSFVTRFPFKPDADGISKHRSGFTQDVAGLFPVAGRFNHSCSPKISYRFRPEHEALVFTVSDWIIRPGDELTISYGKEPPVLYYKYGFSCECGYCAGFDAIQSEWC